jgi:2-polyprenyl-3-methyl-5-hydroxy-6-metoxy-1,4-benzoquinol methylase
MMDSKQKFDIKLTEIVPEYYRSKHIKRIFLKRLEIALSYLQDLKAKNVLDAGCGDGLFTGMVKKLETTEKVVGIDYNFHVEELNKQYEGIKFLRADLLQKLPFDDKFDAVTCLDVLEHFENVEPILKNILNVLNENGFLIVSGPVESFWYKLGRFVTKGSFSQESGPGAGKHYHNIMQLNKLITHQYNTNFELIKTKKIKFLFIHLFNVNLYQQKK